MSAVRARHDPPPQACLARTRRRWRVFYCPVSYQEIWLNKHMKPSVALQTHRDLIRTVVERYRARNPRVFGSVLHGDDNEGSDLDLLVEPTQGATLFDLGAIQIELEEQLGVPGDVLVPKDLPIRFRDA